MGKTDKKGLAIGAVIGAVGGVVAGILFAPKSGKETRKDIKKASEKTYKKVKQEIDNLQNDTKETLRKLEDKAKSLGKKAKIAVEDHIKTVKHATSNLNTVVKSFKAGESSDEELNDAIKQSKSALNAVKDYLKK